MIRTVAIAVCGALVLVSCNRSGTAPPKPKTKFADVTVGLLITTGGVGGELAGPSIGAAGVAADHIKRDSKRKVKIEQADYAGDLAAAPALATELAGKVDVLIVGTDDAAVLPVIDTLNVPVIHAYITRDGVTTRDNVFRVTAPDTLQARRLANFLVDERELSRVGVVFENTDYGNRGAALMKDAISSAGGTLVASEPFDTGGDIHTPLAVAEEEAAQGLVVWTDNAAEASRAVIDIHKSGYSYQIALPGNVAAPQFGKNAVAQVVPTAFKEGILSVGPWAGPWLRAERVKRFFKDFEKKQSDAAPVRTVGVYDSVLLASAAKSGGEIKQGLLGLKDFIGAGVPITFDSSHEGIDETDIWAWGFTKSKNGAGAEFFPAVDTGGGFFTLIPKGLKVPAKFAHEMT